MGGGEREKAIVPLAMSLLKSESSLLSTYFLIIASGKNKWSTHQSPELKFINTWRKNGEKENRKINGSRILTF